MTIYSRCLRRTVGENYPVVMGDEQIGFLGGVLGLPVTHLIDCRASFAPDKGS
jgi:hypothetical protein